MLQPWTSTCGVLILCSLEISLCSNRLQMKRNFLQVQLPLPLDASWGTSIRLHISNEDAIHGMIPCSSQFATNNKRYIPSANRARNPN